MRFLLKLKSVSDAPVRVGIDYRRRFISLLKRILEDEYEKVKVRPYTFAVYFGKEAKITKDFIEGVKHINFRFSTGDSILAVKFYNAKFAQHESPSIKSWNTSPKSLSLGKGENLKHRPATPLANSNSRAITTTEGGYTRESKYHLRLNPLSRETILSSATCHTSFIHSSTALSLLTI